MNLDLSNRLKTIAQFTKPYRHIIDIGTDHCFVPIFLVLNQLIDSAIAIDVNAGPIQEANKNIGIYHLEKVIETRIGNGLNALYEEDPCDVIIIAGMGGKLITDILNTKKSILSKNKKIIVQPNVSENLVRTWFWENHYEIVEEEIMEEDNKIYEILVAEKSIHPIKYSQEELLFGPLLIKERHPLFIKKWEEILQYKESIIKSVPISHPNYKIISNEISLIKDMLKRRTI